MELDNMCQSIENIDDIDNIIRFHDEYPEYFTVKFADLKKMKKISTGGSFSIVYKCEYKGVPVAAKRLFYGKKSGYKYIKSEVEFLFRLYHPNILRYVGVAHNNLKQLYIITEFVDGGDLLSRTLSKKKQLNWENYINIGLQVLNGLIYLESLLVMHRDLKSSNVLISKDLKKVKICDFGTARTFSPENPMKMSLVGTLHYMAPEVYQRKPYSTSIDSFSFGVILLEFMGITKFRKSEHDVFDLNLIKPKIPKNTPNGIFQLALLCLHDDPAVRPPFKEIYSRLDFIRYHLGTCPNASIPEFPPYVPLAKKPVLRPPSLDNPNPKQLPLFIKAALQRNVGRGNIVIGRVGCRENTPLTSSSEATPIFHPEENLESPLISEFEDQSCNNNNNNNNDNNNDNTDDDVCNTDNNNNNNDNNNNNNSVDNNEPKTQLHASTLMYIEHKEIEEVEEQIILVKSSSSSNLQDYNKFGDDDISKNTNIDGGDNNNSNNGKEKFSARTSLREQRMHLFGVLRNLTLDTLIQARGSTKSHTKVIRIDNYTPEETISPAVLPRLRRSSSASMLH